MTRHSSRFVCMLLCELLAVQTLVADDLVIVPPEQLTRYWVVDGSELEYLELSGRRLPTYGCMVLPFVIEVDGRVSALEQLLVWKRSGTAGQMRLDTAEMARVASRALPKFRTAERQPTQAIYTARPVVVLNKTIHRRMENADVLELVSWLRKECDAADLERLQEQSQSLRSSDILPADPATYLWLRRRARVFSAEPR